MTDIKTLVNKIENISKKHKLQTNRSFYSCILQDKNEMLDIIKDIKEYLENIPYLTKYMKTFHMLGFLPRLGKNMYTCSCFIYWYIKSINPSIKIFVSPDGTLKGFIPSNNKDNKEHIILQAHMDVVCLDNSEQAQHFGAYGSTPNIQFYHSGTDNGLWINKNNDNSVLGADDGKGVAEILNLLQHINDNVFNNISYPNISFILTAIEEMPFGKSISDLVKDKKSMALLFPTWFENKLYVNLDSYCGTQIDTYTNQSEKAGKLEKEIIKEYKNFVETKLNKKWTQDIAWNNPPSEVLWVQKYILNLKHCEDLLFISMNADSINPHSNKENIDLVSFDKFNDWFIKWICK